MKSLLNVLFLISLSIFAMNSKANTDINQLFKGVTWSIDTESNNIVKTVMVITINDNESLKHGQDRAEKALNQLLVAYAPLGYSNQEHAQQLNVDNSKLQIILTSTVSTTPLPKDQSTLTTEQINDLATQIEQSNNMVSEILAAQRTYSF